MLLCFYKCGERKIWDKEKQDGKVKNITEFYRKYETEIFNTDIAKKLLERIRGFLSHNIKNIYQTERFLNSNFLKEHPFIVVP